MNNRNENNSDELTMTCFYLVSDEREDDPTQYIAYMKVLLIDSIAKMQKVEEQHNIKEPLLQLSGCGTNEFAYLQEMFLRLYTRAPETCLFVERTRRELTKFIRNIEILPHCVEDMTIEEKRKFFLY